jgi:hypothetical protein
MKWDNRRKANQTEYGTAEQQNSRTAEHQNSRTPEHQNTRTPEHQNTRTPEHQEDTIILSKGTDPDSSCSLCSNDF